LQQLPEVQQLAALLHDGREGDSPIPSCATESTLLDLYSLPLRERRRVLEQGPLSEYVQQVGRPEQLWSRALRCSLPEMGGREDYVVARLIRLLQSDVDRSRQSRGNGMSGAADDAPALALREPLRKKLKLLLAGNPFHAGTVLVYGILEAIQYERVRSILLLKATGWPDELLLGAE
jgi:hypothetical protein